MKIILGIYWNFKPSRQWTFCISFSFCDLCYSFIKLVIDILKHISIVVLQDMENEVKMETEESEDIDIKHEQDVTLELVRVVKTERKVKDSVLLCLLIYKVLH